MGRLISILAAVLVVASGCRTVCPPPLPPVREYIRVEVPVVVPDTSLGVLDALSAEIAAHGRVVDVVQTEGGLRTTFRTAPPDTPGRVAHAMVELAWMQSVLDRLAELVAARKGDDR